MYQSRSHLLCVLRIKAHPFQSLGIEQHGVSSACVHDKRLIRADPVQIRFADVFFIFGPSCSYINITLGVLRNKLLDDLAVFIVVCRNDPREIRLSDRTITSEIAMAV